ncbi:MAG: hydroxymethylpyrimidine/phosphomethylpyrimidine kinase [Alcanivoracaceae bacterium]|nr:hydroxymethylpyrimidine/phosphomethylpyrimidine kinase [Alcanivoracaceae bacterium]
MKPNVLVIAGHDPSGGAGIHADIEAIHSLGGLASTLITGLTVQNSINVQGFALTDVDLLRRQARALLDDYQFSAVKIGMTGSPDIIRFIGEVLDELPGVPVVLDPVLAAEAGGSLGEASVPQALLNDIFPRSVLVTPNLPEARTLTGETDIDLCGEKLLASGCLSAVITGTHDDTDAVENHFFMRSGTRRWQWPRLPGSFHGSGCTLASACAAQLAQGRSLEGALDEAQHYVARCLQNAWQAGKGQLIPDRRG